MTVSRLPDSQRIADHQLFVRSGDFAGNTSPDRQYFVLIGKPDDEHREYDHPGQCASNDLGKAHPPGKQSARNQHQRANCKNKIDILIFGQRSDFFHIAIKGGPDMTR